MKRTPGLWHIILALSLIVMYIRPVEQSMKIWDKRLMPPRRIKQRRNPRRTGGGGPDGWRGNTGGTHR